MEARLGLVLTAIARCSGRSTPSRVTTPLRVQQGQGVEGACSLVPDAASHKGNHQGLSHVPSPVPALAALLSLTERVERLLAAATPPVHSNGSRRPHELPLWSSTRSGCPIVSAALRKPACSATTAGQQRSQHSPGNEPRIGPFRAIKTHMCYCYTHGRNPISNKPG